MANSLDVLNYYEHNLKPDIEKKSDEYIRSVIKSTNINYKVVDQYTQSIEADNEKINAYNKRLLNHAGFGLFLWIIIVISILMIGFGIYFCVSQKIETKISIILISVGAVAALISIILICLRKKEKNKIAPVIQQRDKNINLAQYELKPVVANISKKESLRLFEQSFPQLSINDTFTDVDVNLWKNVLVDHPASSIYSEIHGNAYFSPFLFLTRKRIEIVPCVYTGSTTITIHTQEYDSKTGQSRTVTRTQVVTASITRPKPEFKVVSKMCLKSNLYPELEYSNLAPFKHNSQVKAFYKHNGEQRLMENSDFDLLLPCKRNNEIQFRATFQLYTQEQIVDMIKKGFIKNLQIKKTGDVIQVKGDNQLTSARINLFCDSFLDYSVEKIVNNFKTTMNDVLNGLYSYFAPLFAISLYQNQKYLVNNEKLSTKNANISKFNLETFFNSNHFFTNKFFSPNTSNIVYDAIPKFEIIEQKEAYSIVKMDTFSFSHTPRIHTEFVYAYGQMVSVPIHWNEYFEIHYPRLMITFKTNDTTHDFAYVVEPNSELSKCLITDVYKSMDQVAVVFDPKAKEIKKNAQSIISKVKQMFKLA